MSFCIESDELSYDKKSVYCFLKIILDEIRMLHSFNRIKVFSDGCGSQFKNKFILRSIPQFVKEFGVNCFEWNFFATSHGKGAVGGVGAVVKRKVWQLVRSQNLILKDAQDFHILAKAHISGISLIYVPKNDIASKTQEISQNWLNVKNIPGVKSNHYFASHSSDPTIKMGRTAESIKYKIKN